MCEFIVSDFACEKTIIIIIVTPTRRVPLYGILEIFSLSLCLILVVCSQRSSKNIEKVTGLNEEKSDDPPAVFRRRMPVLGEQKEWQAQ